MDINVENFNKFYKKDGFSLSNMTFNASIMLICNTFKENDKTTEWVLL